MSTYYEQQTAFSDRKCLVDALKKVRTRTGKNWEPVEHDEAVALEGFAGDKRKNTAEIVIPRKQVGGSSNDIGFKRQDDGTYAAIVSGFDKGFHGDKWMAELKTAYTEERARTVAKKAGYQFLRKQVSADGTTKIQFASR